MVNQKPIEKDISKTSKKGRIEGNVTFPRNTVEKSLSVSRCIWENNAGNPMTLLDLTTKLNYSVTSSSFSILIISSSRYGLTSGSWSQDATKTIELTELGKSIIAPAIQDDVEIQKFNALTTPRLFNKVLTSINGKPIPVEDIFKNELVRVHNVQEKDKDSCYNSILKNITELNFYKENNGKKYVMLPTPSSNMMSSDVDDENSMLYENEFDGDEINESSQNKSIRKQIFVAHGKDHKPLEQLKTILDQFKVPYKVAIDESNQGRPISQKVSDLMRECSSAIFLFTKDEKTGRKIHPTNNKMERLNGEIRDREKVFRGLKKKDTPIINGMKVYYNFTKKHGGLGGDITPSEAALIKVDGKNKWKAIIQNANLNQISE